MAVSTDADRIAGILADHFSFDWDEADRRDASGGQRLVRYHPAGGLSLGPACSA
jgi:hypothetical protein